MDVRVGDSRRAYWHTIPTLVSVSSCAAVSGLLFLVFPEMLAASALGDALPLLVERGWALTYMLGGALVLLGVHRLDAKWEVAGLLMLAACYSGYAYAIYAERGFRPAVVAASVFLGLALGCLRRAYILRFEPHRPENQPWRRRRR